MESTAAIVIKLKYNPTNSHNAEPFLATLRHEHFHTEQAPQYPIVHISLYTLNHTLHFLPSLNLDENP